MSYAHCPLLSQALGLDPSTPYDALIERVNGLRQRNQFVERMGDWRHLLTDGVATDCAIRIHINTAASPDHRPAKRARTTPDIADAVASGSRFAEVVPAHTIQAHSLILSSKSEYFKAVLMRGQWAESQDKTIEVELPSEEALVTFKLLMELSYGVDYTRRPSDSPTTTFDPNTLVQLISVGNMFEFLSCIESCCEVLHRMEGWDVDMALSIIDALASLANTHESVAHLLEKAVEKVGVLEELWGQGARCGYHVTAVNMANIDRIKALTSVDALVYLLKSDKLVVDSENTTFTLVHYWLETRDDWDERQKQSAFDTLMDSQALRFERMDPTYLALYALRTPWMAGHKKGGEVLQRVLMVRQGAVWAAAEKGPIPENRSKVQSAGDGCTIEAAVPKQWFAALERGECSCLFIGLAWGMPMTLRISNDERDGGSGSALGIFVGWSTGGLLKAGEGGDELKGALHIKATVSTWPVAKAKTIAPSDIRENGGKGWRNFFDKRWEEVLADGSPYFTPEDTMKITVKVTLPRL